MRKGWISLIFLCLLLCAACGAVASGVTLRTFTPFADIDIAAQGYMDMVTAWEEQSGNVVEDYSGLMDETWLSQLAQMIAAGEADVVVLPVGSGLTTDELVTVEELLTAAPDCGAKSFASMAEADGSVLLAPVRLNWEALYINIDVLTAQGLSVPATFEQLVSVCAALSQAGVTPIANALCEWPEIVLDCAALAGASGALDGAQDVLAALSQAGAFGQDAWNTSDMACEAAFLSGEAAMRIDSSALAQQVDASRRNSVLVINLPAQDGQVSAEVVGTPEVGVAITRACWQDDARREAALDFVRELLSADTAPLICGGSDGLLDRSIAALTVSAQECTGLLYDMDPDGFDAWAESVISSVMAK